MARDKFRNEHAKKNLANIKTKLAEIEILEKLQNMHAYQATNFQKHLEYVERGNENEMRYNQACAVNNAEFLKIEQEETALVDE